MVSSYFVFFFLTQIAVGSPDAQVFGTSCIQNFHNVGRQTTGLGIGVFADRFPVLKQQITLVPAGEVLCGCFPLPCMKIKSLNHLEERLLDQAQVCTSYTPRFWGVIRVAYPKA